MAEVHQLTKQEFEKLNDMAAFISEETQRHQRILNALNLEFKTYLATDVFTRLKIDIKLLDKCVVDMGAGTLGLPDPEVKKDTKQVTEKDK